MGPHNIFCSEKNIQLWWCNDGADFDNQSNFQDHVTFSCISIKPSHGEENLPAEEKRRKSGLS